MDKDLFRIKDHLPRVPSLSFNYSLEKSRSSSINKALRYTSHIALAGLVSLMLGCQLPDQLTGSTSGGSISGDSTSGNAALPGGPIIQCTSGPSDLAGVCRNTSALTPGALEAIGTQVASAAAINTLATAQQASVVPTPDTTPLSIAWSPYPGNAWGYIVYYGPTTDTTTTIASNLPIATGNINASAPSVSYQPTLDLGLNSGDTVCFRIQAYDAGGTPFNWSEVQCTVVS